MWVIEFTPEVRNYFTDNGRYVARLYLVIRDLINTEGIPSIGGATQFERGEMVFEAESHIVFYRRIEEQHLIRVQAVKPLEDTSFTAFLR